MFRSRTDGQLRRRSALIGLLALVAAVGSSDPSAASEICCDPNCDGELTASDALSVLRSSVLLDPPPTPCVSPASTSTSTTSTTLHSDSPDAPNVIIILTDDLGWGDVGAYGNAAVQTPNIDQLAAEGTLFSQAYVSSGVCSPSRVALYTGRNPSELSVHNAFATHNLNEARGMPDWLDTDVATLSDVLRGTGYITAHFGKWHMGLYPGLPGVPTPADYGVDTAFLAPTWSGGINLLEPTNQHRSTELIVDEVVRFLEGNGSQRFLANVWLLDPHAPLNPTASQTAAYANLKPGGGVPDRSARQIYYSVVSEIDRNVGRILSALERLGLSEDTLVIFTSDNGPEDIRVREAGHSGVGSAGPFRGGKRSLYEGGIRVPFIARWPGQVPPGHVNRYSVVSMLDILPTLARWNSVEEASLPEGLDGEYIGDILLGSGRHRKTPLYWEWRFDVVGDYASKSPRLAVRSGKWKLLANPDSSRIELYDLHEDPFERHNLAIERPNVSRPLVERLLDWGAALPDGPASPGAGLATYPFP